MDYFTVEGGKRLRGEILPSGSKNEALPAIAAALLTDEEVVLDNCPDIKDVRIMLSIVQTLGAEVEIKDKHKVRIRARNLKDGVVDAKLGRRIRASILLAGPLLARLGHVNMPPPGGDVIGRRRLDTHFDVFRSLGASLSLGQTYEMKFTTRPTGKKIFMDEQSVTATENAIMTAILANGTTVMENAAGEPSIQGLANMLNSMGAKIYGAGTNRLEIHGVEKLHGTTHRIGGDYLEAASYAALAAVMGDGVLIRDFPLHKLGKMGYVFNKLGIRLEQRETDCFVPGNQELVIQSDLHSAIPSIDDAPWPQFPTDLMSIAITTATQTRGNIIFFEKMYDGRMFFVDTLINMGARIIPCDPHRVVVVGPSRLMPTSMETPDIRAGMALLIAALIAEGKSEIRNINQIDRGYEAIENKLRSLGADITRVSS